MGTEVKEEGQMAKEREGIVVRRRHVGIVGT